MFEPELMISLATSFGDEYTFAAGDSIDLVMGDSMLDFTPTYTLNNTFTNETDLSIIPTLWLQALEASIDTPFGDFGLGPLWEDEFPITGLPTIPVYDSAFSLAFNDFTTASFEVVPTPEPATLLLIGTGLIGLAFFGRKRTKSRGLPS